MARFPRRARLLKPGEFKAVFANGRRAQSTLFTVIAARNQTGQPRLGLAIARKSVPLAVRRNRLKRHIREGFRQNRQRLPDLDLVFLARPGAGAAKAADIRQQLQGLWTRLVEQWPAR